MSHFTTPMAASVVRARRARRLATLPVVQALESRRMLSYPNVLVNSTAADIGSNDTQSESTMVLGSNNCIAVGFNDSESNAGNNHFTGFSTSSNGGTSFTDQGTLPASSAGDAGDPTMARDNATGRIYFATLGYSNANVLQVFRSDNNGVTYAAPVDGAPGYTSGHFLDKEWIAVDNSGGASQGDVYLSYTDFTSVDNGIYITHSTDHGNTWSSPVAIGGSQGSYVTVGPDGSVYVFYYNGSNIAFRKSTDGGNTFGAASVVASLSTTGVNGDLGLTVSNTNSTYFRSNAFPQAVVTSNAIYVTYDDKGTTPGDKADVFLAESTNGGASWTKVRVNSDSTTTDQWQPSIAITPDGSHLGIFWYDRRNDPINNALIDRYGVIATISGTTVSLGANFRITDTAFPAVVGQDPLINSTYMGDYDVAVASNSAFYTTWGDNRLADAYHTNQPDVRLATIPLQGTTHYSVTPTTGNPTAGSPFGLTVSALDANGNVDPTYRGTVHFTTTDPGSGVVVPVDYTFTATDNGVHVFSGVTLTTAGSQSVTATDTTTQSITGVANETVAPSTATHYTLSAPANATVGTPFSVTVTARDAYNNVATGYIGTVHFTTSDSGTGVVLPADYTFTTTDNGTHTFTNGVTLVSTGTQSLTATDTVTGSIAGNANVNVTAVVQATKFLLQPSVTTTTAGTLFSITLTAQAANDTTATSYTGTVHFTSTDANVAPCSRPITPSPPPTTAYTPSPMP